MEHEILREWSESPDQRSRLRAQIALRALSGQTVQRIAEELGVASATVSKWRQRYADRGLPGLYDLPRPGQPRRLSHDARAEIVRVTREEPPLAGSRWTIRTLARRLNVTQHQVRAVWKEAGIAPAASEQRPS